MSKNRFGFYTAIVTTVLTLFTFAIAIATPPPAGPYCKAEKCYEYPYSDVASRFPRDYYWMYPAIVLSLVFILLMACIHHYASEEKKVYSLVGFSFAVISSAFLILDYFVQVSVIQPSLVNGETDGVAMLSQFNPHGLFIAIEEIGYLMMSAAFLFMAPVFAGGTKVERWLRWLFVGSFILNIIALAIYSFQYGIFREYRFEVASISIDWLVLIVSGILLSILFRREKVNSIPSKKPTQSRQIS